MDSNSDSNALNTTPLPVETERGVSILFRGKYIYSKFAPEKSALRIAQTTQYTPNTLYIIPSPLLCYGVSEILAQIDSQSHLFLWEPIEALVSITNDSLNKLKLPDEMANKISYSTQSNPLSDIKELIQRFSFRAITPITLSAGNNFYLEEFQSLLTQSTLLISEYWKNRSTKSFLALRWYQNIFANIASIIVKNKCPLSLSNKIIGKKIVVIGAGESLEQMIPQLNKNRNFYFIIVADTALPALLHANITPDLLVVLEAQHHNFKSLTTVKQISKEITLVCDIVTDPKVARLFNNKVWISSTFSSEKFLSRFYSYFTNVKPILELGSVGIVALHIGLSLASKYQQEEIITAGLDFEFANGKSHTRGSSYHLLKLKRQSKLSPIENGYNANILSKSDKVLDQYKETAIQLTKLSNINVGGPSAFTQSPQLTTIETANKANKLPLTFSLQSNEAPSTEKACEFLQNEIDLLQKMLSCTTGMTQWTAPGAPLAYLTETFIMGSKEKGDNLLAGKIKLNGSRLLEQANQSLSLLRTDKKAF